MSNSFYYFFSATPQVLGAVLALFGVFVIFKIQDLKSQMTGIGQSILDNRLTIQTSTVLKISVKVANIIFIDRIEKSVRKKDIDGLKTSIDLIDDKDYLPFQERFNELLDFHKYLIKQTIFYSTITAGAIVLCLLIIPFGNFILKCDCFLYFAIGIVLICTIIAFYGIIFIIKKSFS